ncbi:hypothetical protein [Armatimonas sp.]|uniref:hypothetical protein n=1 Tax=Armatimonas sp. TaxID=1872638 RepID=UPI0037528E08
MPEMRQRHAAHFFSQMNSPFFCTAIFLPVNVKPCRRCVSKKTGQTMANPISQMLPWAKPLFP